MENIKIVKLGYTQANCGNELYVNTTTDEMITLTIKDRELLLKTYCNYVRVTVDVITEEEFDKENADGSTIV